MTGDAVEIYSEIDVRSVEEEPRVAADARAVAALARGAGPGRRGEFLQVADGSRGEEAKGY